MLNAVPLLMFSPVIFSRQMGLFFLASVFLLQEVSAVGSRPDPFRDNLSHTDGTEPGDFFLSASLRYANGENSQDWALSFSNLLRAASFGQPQAQHAVASAYSTGLYRGLRVPMDPGRSLVLDYFSTLAGTPEAHMSIGHRYLKGLGVPRSCEKAAIHYEFAANHAAEQILSRGYALRSVQSELTNHIPWLSDDDNESELIQYYDRMAQEGDARSIHTLGMLYLQGSLHTDQNLQKAADYFQLGDEASFSASSGQLGMMYARGIGVKIDEDKAFEILKRASRHGDATGILGLGYCYQHGIGVNANASKALELYQSVTNKHEEAGFFTAELILGSQYSQVLDTGGAELAGKRKDSQILGAAQQFYMTSANRGHILSIHRIGHIGLAQKSTQTCAIAQNFKAVAEAGDWGHKSTIAHRKYNEGNIREALQLFSELAHQGYESAQINAAFILSKMYCPEQLQLCSDDLTDLRPCMTLPIHGEDGKASDPITDGTYYMPFQWRMDKDQLFVEEERSYTSMHTGHDGGFAAVPHVDAMECERRALALYAHSALQGSGHGYLKIGDFHYYGLGSLTRDKKEAARYYQIAADMKITHALFNLGIMHETGDGVLKDFYLAKRFYDGAALYDVAAKTPSTLAVGILRAHSTLQNFLGENATDEMLDELAQFVVRVDRYFGLGPLIFAARSYLIRIWLTLNKSVLISSSSRFESDAYSSGRSLFESIVKSIKSEFHIMSSIMTRSPLWSYFSSLNSSKAKTGEPLYSAELFSSDVISTLLFCFSVVLFIMILRYRAARIRRMELR